MSKKIHQNIRNARDSQNESLCATVHNVYLLKSMRLLFAFCDRAFVRALFSMCSNVVHKRNSGCTYLKEETFFEGVVWSVTLGQCGHFSSRLCWTRQCKMSSLVPVNVSGQSGCMHLWIIPLLPSGNIANLAKNYTKLCNLFFPKLVKLWIKWKDQISKF